MLEKKEFYIISSKDVDELVNKTLLSNSSARTRYKFYLDWIQYPIFEDINWYLDPESLKALEKFINENDRMPGMSRILLKKLCSLALIPEGNYIVKVEYDTNNKKPNYWTNDDEEKKVA